MKRDNLRTHIYADPPPYTDEPEDSEERVDTTSLYSATSLHTYPSSRSDIDSYTDEDDGFTIDTDEAESEAQLQPSGPPPSYEILGSTKAPALRHDQPGDTLSTQTCHWKYTQDPEALFNLITEQAALPPRPVLHCFGDHKERHEEGDKTKTKTVRDFDIYVNLQNLFDPSVHVGQGRCRHPHLMRRWHLLRTVPDNVRAYRGGLFRRRATKEQRHARDLEAATEVLPPASLSQTDLACTTSTERQARIHAFRAQTDATHARQLRYWCAAFCARASHSWLPYSFTFRRDIGDWKQQHVREQLESMIRSTNYRGYVGVTVRVQDGGFTVYSAHWMNRLRCNWWVWWTFVVLQLWIVAWPVLWLCTGKYDVVQAVWPFARQDARHEAGKVYAYMSEDEWLDTWGLTLVEWAFSRGDGWLTDETVNSYLQERQNRINHTTSQGNYVPDTVAEIFSALQRASREPDRTRGWGYNESRRSNRGSFSTRTNGRITL